ncbi:MAG: peptidylprolyl isomerase, partial [Planctomycetota bacterium]
AQIGGCTPDLSDAIEMEIQTNLGPIAIELYPNMTPVTVQNFLDYAEAGDYDGVIFHRSVPGFVVQAGGFREQAGSYVGIATAPPILNEPCLSNTRATIAMARIGGQPDSATSQWFVNLADNTFLDGVDGGFTVFGSVQPAGMLVADAIAALPIFDTLAYLELPVNQVIRELPVASLPVESPPGSYGCSRDTPLFGLAEVGIDTIVFDLLRTNLPGAVVPILLDPLCTGAGAVGPPSVPCTPGVGRDVFEVDLDSQVFYPPRIPMTCDAVAESEDSWALRRAGTAPQLLAEDVEIISVPEPGSALGMATSLLLLIALNRMRRTSKPSTELRMLRASDRASR